MAEACWVRTLYFNKTFFKKGTETPTVMSAVARKAPREGDVHTEREREERSAGPRTRERAGTRVAKAKGTVVGDGVTRAKKRKKAQHH